MNFIYSTDHKPAAIYIADTIREHLEKGERVLWVISGGSAVSVAVLAAEILDKIPHQNLSVMLADERYGPVGHEDSNWTQLIEAGFMLRDASLYPVLTGNDRDGATKYYAERFAQELSEANFTIGLFGIGADGHTAGILPKSEAVYSTAFLCGYDGGTYSRITMTPSAIREFDEAVVLALGSPKWPTLAQLAGDATIEEQPAQVLKQVPQLTIFTDKK